MIKKKVLIILLALNAIFITATCTGTEKEISFHLNGKEFELSTSPVNINGTIMVPYDDFVKLAGGYLAFWKSDEKTAYYSDRLVITVGSKTIQAKKDIQLKEAPIIVNNKLMLPFDFVQEHFSRVLELVWNDSENLIECYSTKINFQRAEVLTAYPEKNDTTQLEDNLKMYLRDFNPSAFLLNFENIKNGSGVMTYSGIHFKERIIKVTLVKNRVTLVEDNLQFARNLNEIGNFNVTDNDEFTESIGDYFDIKLYSKKEFDSNEEITAWADVSYVGEPESILFSHSDPCFTVSISDGKKYFIGGSVDNVGISSIWKKGETKRFNLFKSGGYGHNDPDAQFWEEFFSTREIYLPKGEYTITGNLDITFADDGKSIEQRVKRRVVVK